MRHFLTDEQHDNLLRRMRVVYNNWKVTGGWDNSDERNSHWKEGIIDFMDSLIFVSSELTYDISSLRNELEKMFEEIDMEE